MCGVIQYEEVKLKLFMICESFVKGSISCYDFSCSIKNLFLVTVIKRRLEIIQNKSYNSTDRENEDIFHYAIRIIFEIKEISLKEESIFGSPNEVRWNV